MSDHAIMRWTGDGLAPADDTDANGPIAVADSWLVSDGAALAIGMHRGRFLASLDQADQNAAEFWDAAIAAIPRTGDWFPRVEARTVSGAVEFFLRLRPAPARSRSVTLRTHAGPDPRIRPTVKGPSLETLEALRADARADGVDDLVILDPLGHIVEGAATAIAWWRGEALCLPAQELERVDSVTARALAALATAAGTAISWETIEPGELDGHEVWALNALHGPRIVAAWRDGPATAEQPGRLATWRARLDALRKPLAPTETATVR